MAPSMKKDGKKRAGSEVSPRPSSSKASSSKSAAKHGANRKAVNPSSLAWSTVRIPTEAQAGGAGVTESDFFNTLNWEDDDFMGLQEIDDVDVQQETRPDGSRIVSFVTTDNKIKSSSTAKSKPSADAPRDTTSAKITAKSKKRKIQELAPESHPSKESISTTEVTNDDTASMEEESDKGLEEGESSDKEDVDLDDEDLAEAFKNAHDLELDEDEEDDAEFDDTLLPAWSHLPLHGALKRALLHKKFAEPTEIQKKSLPAALGLPSSPLEGSDSDAEAHSSRPRRSRRDVIGISQTGSGKTLAYGLPILDYLYKNAENVVASMVDVGDDDDVDLVPPPLGALILCPTRELALQVSSHLNDVVRASCHISADDVEISKRKLIRRPQIAVVCGGMSEQKQRRLLQGRSRQGATKTGVDIIVATPGRLWEMTRLDDHLAARIKQARFLVLDEADRMVEVGHFAEMEHILNLVNRADAVRPAEGKEGQQDDTEDANGSADVAAHGVRPNDHMQTFVFSATLSKALQVNLKRRKKVKQFTKKKHLKNQQNATTLEDLMERVDFRDEEPAIIDLTPGQGLPEGLMETKIECFGKDKDLYLYYFLLRYPGRTLVFVNSIDGIRRLAPILAQLNMTSYPIHSQLQQKQRLKNLDRFRSFQKTSKVSSCVLLATDVAARGLDIPSVEHVVHYQIPRSADTYVHRSGRTARAGTSGVSLALIEPKEKTLWSQLCRTLGRKSDIPTFPITFSTLTLLRERVDLALAIDKQIHQNTKQAYEDNWLAKLAEEADLDLSEDDMDPDAPVGKNSHSRAQDRKNTAKLNELQARLATLLQKPITMKGLSHRYITASGAAGSAWVDDMVANRNHDQILGVMNTDAQTDLKAKTPALPKSKKTKLDSQPKQQQSKPSSKTKVDRAHKKKRLAK